MQTKETEVPEYTLADWIEQHLFVDYATKFSFEGRPYLRQIHNLGERSILFRTGRQVEKTSSLAAKLVSYSCLVPAWKSLYVSPSQGQTRIFSHSKLSRSLASPHVKQHFFDSISCIDHVYEKELKNGSTILLNYASTSADRCRGISAHMLLCDEIQDMSHDVFPVLEETLSHSEYGFRVYAGTPKTLNNSMETHWKNSTQCEWMIHCEGCGAKVYQDEKIIREEGPCCPSCGRRLVPQNGQWVPTGDPAAEFMGFRIPQTMVPWIVELPHKWRELWKKSQKWAQREFYNEVLGIAHEKGANPVTESDLKACCSENMGIYSQRPTDRFFDTLYAGVDWGAGIKSFTVLSIVGMHGGKPHLVYMKRFADLRDDPNGQVEEIAKTIARFGAVLAGCDWGSGFVQNKDLALALTGMCDVIQMYESSAKKRGIGYTKGSGIYTLNRTAGLAHVFQLIKARNIVLPRWQDFQEFAEDFTCIFEDYNQAIRQLVYDHPENMPDDATHSLMFALMAMRVARGEKVLDR